MAVSSLALIVGGFLLLATIIVIIKKPGVIKKNENEPLSLKNFSLKKTFIGDWKSFFIWALLMFLVWSYATDTQSCRDMIENIDEVCRDYMNSRSEFWANEDYIDQLNNGTNTTAWRYNKSIGPNLIPPNS